jgi:hypothetical protein
MRVSSYSKADTVEQRDIVNSGVRGTKDRNLRTEVGGCGLYEHRNYYLPYHNQVPSAGNLWCWYSRRRRCFGLVAGGSSGRCGHARAVYYTTVYNTPYRSYSSIVRRATCMHEQQGGGAQERSRE